MIIHSLLDQDLYSFSVMQLVYHHFPGVQIEYTLKNRGNENLLELKGAIEGELQDFCTLRFTEAELDYLRTIRYLKPDFIDFLSLYQPNIRHVVVDEKDGELSIKVTGPWLLTIFFEVPILAMLNELYSEKYVDENEEGRTCDILHSKLDISRDEGVYFSEFGTRRRSSYYRQDQLFSLLPVYRTFIGTSNVHFAMKYGLTPIGTMSHQIFMAAQAVGPRVVDSQKFMLQKWVDEYRGDLGIALTDTIGIDAFLKDFDLYFAKLYDGLRHDSGDPIEFGYKVVEHYKKLRIDPMTKKIVFSDSLTFPKAVEIAREFKGVIPVSFGIGTNLTNDPKQGHPLNIVMKPTRVNGQPVVKISDSPGKSQCEDIEYENYVKKVFGVNK